MDAATKRWLDEVYHRRVLQARAMPPEEELFAGVLIFEQECRLTAAGIRSHRPDASEEQVQQIVGVWLELTSRLT